MKLQNTRLGAFNWIQVGEVIDVKEEEVKGYLDVGFTKYVEKEEVKEEKTPEVGNSGINTKKLADAKAEVEKMLNSAKLDAAKIVSDAKEEAEKIKTTATEEAAKIVSDAKVTPEVTENKEIKPTTTQK